MMEAGMLDSELTLTVFKRLAEDAAHGAILHRHDNPTAWAMMGGYVCETFDVRATYPPNHKTATLSTAHLLAVAVLAHNDEAAAAALADYLIEAGIDPVTAAYEKGRAEGFAEGLKSYGVKSLQGRSHPDVMIPWSDFH